MPFRDRMTYQEGDLLHTPNLLPEALEAHDKAAAEQKFDESDWLGTPLDEALSKGIDPAKLDNTPAPKLAHGVAKSKGKMDFDKTSPYFHPCDKCHGSGSFTGYTGRRVGPCRACHGKGGFMRVVTVAQKHQIDQRKAQAKQQKLADDLAAFTRDHKAEYDWIAANPRFDFAVSMGQALAQYGHLTDNQLAAIGKCIARDKDRAAEKVQREANAPVIDTTKLAACFATAHAEGLKKPKMRFEGFAVSEAPLTGKNAGALYVTGERSADDLYFGKIVAGKFLATRDTPQSIVDAVVLVLNDPLAAAVAYGKKTGVCSCCGAELTNAESIARGIGPICAGKFGL